MSAVKFNSDMSKTKSLFSFCRELPKVELHAHLNGSLSRETMLLLKRYHADSGIADKTDVFFDEFLVGAGDTRNLSDCFQVFSIAHSLTSTPQSLAIAVARTLKEFQDDGCCYIELRSTPKDTSYMNRKQYVNTIIEAINNFSIDNTMITKLIISIDRRFQKEVAQEIVSLAIETYKQHSDVVVGVELSGDPTLGRFLDFVTFFTEARAAGLKVTLHCGEVCNPTEIMEMLKFKPDRIGHGTCIHPSCAGTDETWNLLCQLKIPVEVCLTSNVNTKSCVDYGSHHVKYFFEADIPVVICTDDKGVFCTSLSQEYLLCAESFDLDREKIASLAMNASKQIFDQNSKKKIFDKICSYIGDLN